MPHLVKRPGQAGGRTRGPAGALVGNGQRPTPRLSSRPALRLGRPQTFSGARSGTQMDGGSRTSESRGRMARVGPRESALVLTASVVVRLFLGPHARPRTRARCRPVPRSLSACGTVLCRVRALGRSGLPGRAFPGHEVAAWFPGGNLSPELRLGPRHRAQGPVVSAAGSGRTRILVGSEPRSPPCPRPLRGCAF